jgi:hypothetical protein
MTLEPSVVSAILGSQSQGITVWTLMSVLLAQTTVSRLVPTLLEDSLAAVGVVSG